MGRADITLIAAEFGAQVFAHDDEQDGIDDDDDGGHADAASTELSGGDHATAVDSTEASADEPPSHPSACD